MFVNKDNININDVALDSFIGGQILGLIGISNPELQPQLEYLSPTGLGLYRVPLKRVTQYCIGGNYPTVQFMRDHMKHDFVPEMLRQTENYTTPPRPDYQSVMTPWFTEDDLKEWKERQGFHMNILDWVTLSTVMMTNDVN